MLCISPCDQMSEDKIKILKTKEDVEKYLIEILRLKPKLLAFDYQTTAHGERQRIIACSMCWQLIRSVSWEWKNTDIKLFRKVLESGDIGKPVLYHEQEIKLTATSIPRTKINGLIKYEYPIIIKSIMKFSKLIESPERLLKHCARNSLRKYKLTADQIIELGIIL